MLCGIVLLMQSCSTYTFYKGRERTWNSPIKTSKYGYEFKTVFNESMRIAGCVEGGITWHALTGVKTKFFDKREESFYLKWAWVSDVDVFIVTAMVYGEHGTLYEFDDEFAYAYGVGDTLKATVDYDDEFWYLTIGENTNKVLRTFHPRNEIKRSWAIGPKLNKFCNNARKVKMCLKIRT